MKELNELLSVGLRVHTQPVTLDHSILLQQKGVKVLCSYFMKVILHSLLQVEISSIKYG